MKKYTDIYKSAALYAIALLIAFLSPKALAPSVLSQVELWIIIIAVVIGIFFGFKSIKSKESSWLGHLMVLIGGLILASPLIFFMIGANSLLW